MPALNPVISKLDDVAEPVRQFYEAKDGAFHLALSAAPAGFVAASELAVANGKVVEFRDANILLNKFKTEAEPVLAKFKDIDPDAAREAITKVAELGKRGVKGADDIATLVQSAVAAALAPVQTELTAIKTTNQETVKRNQELVLKTTLAEKFTKLGGVPEALNFILGEAKSVFEVVDGKVQAVATAFSSTRPGSPIELDEWITQQAKVNAFAFKPSGGGGADPARNPGGNNGNTTFSGRVIKNPTPQQLGDPLLGKELKAGTLRFEYDAADLSQ